MAKYGIQATRGYIYVFYHHQDQRFTISTRFSDATYDWRSKSLDNRHSDYTKARRVVDTITNNMITASQRVITAGYEPTAHLVRQEYQRVLESLDPLPAEPKFPDFYERWDEFMKIKAVETRLESFRNYNQVYALLREFEYYDHYKMDFNTFDGIMFGRLKQYMFMVKKYKDSTIDKHIRNLRTFFKWAVPEMSRTFMKFTPRLPDNIYPLEPGELRYVIDTEMEGYLGKTKDLFVFCACTGMRYSDSQKFEQSWIRDGIIDFVQTKTSEQAVVPLLDTANRILVRYGGNTPKISNPAYNRHLKDLFQELEFDRIVRITSNSGGKTTEKNVRFWEQVTSHTARKTFITYALSQGVPIQDVMRMSGHSDYKMMKPYISISKKHMKGQVKKLDL